MSYSPAGSRGFAASMTATSAACPSRSRAARVCCAMAGLRSTAVSRPVGRTARASARVAAPRPHPMSSARSPGPGAKAATSPSAAGTKNGTPLWS